ncbi:uncharacterized protein LOC117479030 [Trematomus bernacchii]|uniref:uncharacterized protein LOC117479030 n=1 Tax=Trematomus bernacchii TaxID=40690 RepID=UPI001469B5CA|nr:uncharacterized protein LOC117479030 [Trematomus bernacchii]
MFPRGHSGQDEPYKSELLPLSPKRQDLEEKRSKSPNVGRRMRRKLQKCLQGIEDNSLSDLSSVDTACTKADLVLCGEKPSSDCLVGVGVLEDTLPKLIERIKNKEEKKEMEDEDAEQGSGNIVEHILKELKGINKIQEEISDLRQYLTSVRGSVDEVSCCVDAVLSEIGELYSGASAAPEPSPVSQTPRIRRGSLGRQNAITSLHGRYTSPLLDCKDCGTDCGCMPSQRSPEQWHVDRVTFQSEQQTDKENSKQSSNTHMLGHTKPDPCYLDIQQGHDYQSTSSLSSCHSSNCQEASFISGDTQYQRWPSGDMHHSISRETGWSEEDIYSCANSREGLENCLGVWDRCATEETRNSTPGHSSHDSSEHLSLLFGQHSISPTSSASMVDWRPPRLQKEEEHLECDCSANCPYSRSSGYHTMGACANEMGSDPSRSLSCSTVLLTDCDDGYLETNSLCEDCPSSGDTLDLGSADSLDREWTDHINFKDEAAESLSPESSEIDADSPSKTPNVGFDVTTLSKAVLTFRSALKGALKKLEVPNPEGVKDDSGTEATASPVGQRSEPKEERSSTDYTEGEVSVTENHTQCGTPKEESEASVYVDCSETRENISSFLQASPRDASPSPCTPTEYHSVEISEDKGECPTDGELSNSDLTPDHCPIRKADSPLGTVLSTNEVRLSPIKENHVPDEVIQEKHMDASHKERVANFQRILREKRQTRHRLSKSAHGSQGSHGSHGSQGSQGSHGSQGSQGSHGSQGSQGSHGSQGSQGSQSQSQDEFYPECGGEDNQVTHITLSL